MSDVEVTDTILCDHLGRMSCGHLGGGDFTAAIIRPLPIYKTVSFRKLRSIDVETLKRDVTDSTILHPFNSSVDELANNGLHSLIDKHAPLCTKSLQVHGTLTNFTEQRIYDENSRTACNYGQTCTTNTCFVLLGED